MDPCLLGVILLELITQWLFDVLRACDPPPRGDQERPSGSKGRRSRSWSSSSSRSSRSRSRSRSRGRRRNSRSRTRRGDRQRGSYNQRDENPHLSPLRSQARSGDIEHGGGAKDSARPATNDRAGASGRHTSRLAGTHAASSKRDKPTDTDSLIDRVMADAPVVRSGSVVSLKRNPSFLAPKLQRAAASERKER